MGSSDVGLRAALIVGCSDRAAAVASALANRGITVHLADINRSAATNLAKQLGGANGRAYAHGLDLRDASARVSLLSDLFYKHPGFFNILVVGADAGESIVNFLAEYASRVASGPSDEPAEIFNLFPGISSTSMRLAAYLRPSIATCHIHDVATPLPADTASAVMAFLANGSATASATSREPTTV